MIQFLKGDPDRCEHLREYFTKENLPQTAIKVLKAKNPTKILGKKEHFEYESVDYEVSKFKSKYVKQPRPIDWIGMQWPGGEGSRSKPPTPWEYELVVLTKEFNIKKENVSSQQTNSRQPC